MNDLYTFGYGGRTVTDLLASLDPLGAILVDIRYSPFSRNAAYWNKGSLLKVLDTRYLHVPELGNVNYKSGGDIQIADLGAGAAKVAAVLAHYPVVLLCVCKDVRHCHRKVVGEALAEQFGVSLTHLPLPLAREGGLQLSLLG